MEKVKVAATCKNYGERCTGVPDYTGTGSYQTGLVKIGSETIVVLENYFGEKDTPKRGPNECF